MQQRVPEGSEFAATPAGTQPAVEAPAKDEQRSGEEEGLHMPGEDLRPPRRVAGPRRPHRDKEALQPETWREEVEV